MLFGGNPEQWKAWREAQMPQAEPETEPQAVEIDPVTGWRYGFLLGLGFDPLDSLEMAFSKNVDLHRAEGLIRSGCPQETAVRILL